MSFLSAFSLFSNLIFPLAQPYIHLVLFFKIESFSSVRSHQTYKSPNQVFESEFLDQQISTSSENIIATQNP